jgi:hypothetical protein
MAGYIHVLTGPDCEDPNCYDALCDYLRPSCKVHCEEDKSYLTATYRNWGDSVIEQSERWLRNQGWDIRIVDAETISF